MTQMNEDKDRPKIELWDIDKIVPCDTNAKNHPESQVDKIANAIQEFGFDVPIVVDKKGVIIKGHGRRLASIKLGLKKVPVIQRKDLTAEQARLARLADNKISESDYNVEILQSEMMDLSLDFDLRDYGFSDHELEFMTQELGKLNEEAFVSDLGKEVSEKDAKDQETIDAVEGDMISFSKIWGESKCTMNQARLFKSFRAFLDSKYPDETSLMARFTRYIEEQGV